MLFISVLMLKTLLFVGVTSFIFLGLLGLHDDGLLGLHDEEKVVLFLKSIDGCDVCHHCLGFSFLNVPLLDQH